MADEHRDDARETEASLELPSFGLRRRRRSSAIEPTTEPTTEPGTRPVPAPPEPTVATAHEEPTTVVPVVPAVAGPTGPGEPVEPVAPVEPAAPPAPLAPATHGGAAETATRSPRARRRPTLPSLGVGAAALVTGLVVGLVGVVLTLLSVSACEAVRGTSSCGGAGFFALGAIVLVMYVLGRGLLSAWQVRDPGSTSVLAVGLVVVVSLTVLIEVILSWTMVVVVPLVTMAAFGVSHWVTTKVADAETEA